MRQESGNHKKPCRPVGPVARRGMNIVIAALALIIGAATLQAENIDSVNDEVEYLFTHTHIKRSYSDSALKLLAAARPGDPTNERALALWCQLNQDLGDNTSDKGEKLHIYGRVLAAAETLRTLDSMNPDGHFWWAVTYGDIGMAEGLVQSIGRLSPVKHELVRTIELDSNYAFAYAILAMLYRDLPGIGGGSLSKSRAYFDEGIARAPNFTLLRLELAKLDIKEGRWTDARDQLNQLLACQDPVNIAAFFINDKPKAESLLVQIQNK
jgi:tetratricopeptide (TPR) repeat protein